MNDRVKELANRKDIRGLHDYAATKGGINLRERKEIRKLIGTAKPENYNV